MIKTGSCWSESSSIAQGDGGVHQLVGQITRIASNAENQEKISWEKGGEEWSGMGEQGIGRFSRANRRAGLMTGEKS